MSALIRLSDRDNVAVAAQNIKAGTALDLDGETIIALEPIPFAHKVAIRAIDADGHVFKYGVPIGRANAAIEPGRHVHVHNIRSDYVNNEVEFFEDAFVEGSEGAAS